MTSTQGMSRKCIDIVGQNGLQGTAVCIADFSLLDVILIKGAVACCDKVWFLFFFLFKGLLNFHLFFNVFIFLLFHRLWIIFISLVWRFQFEITKRRRRLTVYFLLVLDHQAVSVLRLHFLASQLLELVHESIFPD